MKIESTDLIHTDKALMQAGSTGAPLIKHEEVIDMLAGLAQEAGWTVGGLLAHQDLFYPLSFPTVVAQPPPAGGLLPVNCNGAFVHLDGMNFVPYNPFTESPGGEGANCRFFKLGVLPREGIDNLAEKITAETPWDATAIVTGLNTFTLHIIAKHSGPKWNYRPYRGDGRFGIGGTGGTKGGGYTMKSQEKRDSGGQLVTTQMKVQVTSGDFFNADTFHLTHTIKFDFATTIDSLGEVDEYGLVIVQLDSIIYSTFGDDVSVDPAPGVLLSEGLLGDPLSGQNIPGTNMEGYTIIVNPYSFALFCATDDSFSSVFACAPYIPTEEGFASAKAWFIVTGFTGSTDWPNGYISLDGTADHFMGDAHPRLATVRVGGTSPLMTPSGTPFVGNSWIMFGHNSLDKAAVVGKLWDCATVSDSTEGFVIGGDKYVRLAKQEGLGGTTRCSLMMRVKLSSVNTAGFVDEPLQTRDYPIYFSIGMTIDDSGNMTRNSGVHFDPSMIGQTIFFGLFSGVIVSVTDEDHASIGIPTTPHTYIAADITGTTVWKEGGGVVHNVPTYGVGDITLSPTGDATRLTRIVSNYYFGDYMVNMPIVIQGHTYTITRLVDDSTIGFWPPAPSVATSVAFSIAS